MAKKILVVDDDIDILEAIQLTLELNGYETEITTKGEHVINTAIKTHPDLILLDVLLSGKDGRAICKQLKKETKTKNIPVIMLSAHPTAHRDANISGADGFIPKPFDIDDLLAKISGLIQI